jgi:hypothetical protein
MNLRLNLIREKHGLPTNDGYLNSTKIK